MSNSKSTINNTLVIPTPFHERTKQVCRRGHWTNWAGYHVVDEYSHTEFEYFAVRNQCGVLDLSPMIKYAISGKDVIGYLNRLLIRDVRKLSPGRVAYVLFCNKFGHTIDDATLFRFSENEFQLYTQDRHLPWLSDSAIGFDVKIEDVTEKIAALALQGPTSCALLKHWGLADIELLKPFSIQHFIHNNLSFTLSRTGFTGDLGYEIWINPEDAILLWDELFNAGKHFGLVPFGSSALEILRIEAGFILPHVDFIPANQILRHNRGRSPIELGFKHLIDFDKGFFNGKHALESELKTGSQYKLVGLEIMGNKPATDALVYYKKHKKVGHITSAIWSPSCKSNIALALLQSDVQNHNLNVDIYTKKELKWSRSMMPCQIVPTPFYSPKRKFAMPAGLY